MSSFEIVKLITLRELKERGRTKAYLLSALMTLVLIAGVILVPRLLGGGETVYEIGSLGEGNSEVLRVTETIGAESAGDDGFSLEVTEFDDRADAEAALVEGTVEFVLVDGTEILREGTSGFSGSRAENTVQRAAAIVGLQAEIGQDAITPDAVAGALGGDPLRVNTLQGESSAAEEAARSIIAYAGMFLLYMAILIYGNWTLQGIVEEKASRIVEVLLATVRPWHLMAGKIIGIGVLGLAQMAVTVVWALLLIRVTGALELPAIPVDSAVALVVWFVLGFALYSVMYATVGALVGRMEDAQSVSFPITMVAIVGFLVSFQVLNDPAGLLARVTTFIPFLSPYVVPVRVAYSEIALWEYGVSILVTIVTIVALVRIAARVYAGGLLNFTGKMSLKKAYQTAETR